MFQQSCPSTNRVVSPNVPKFAQIFGHDLVPLSDTIRDTIRDTIVSLSRVPSSSSSSIEGNPQLGLDYPVEDPPPVCTWHRKEQSIVFFSYRHRSLPT